MAPKEQERVLIIDDDPQISALLRAFLGMEGYRTRSTWCLREAFLLLKAEPSHHTLLDLRLPDSDPEHSWRAIPALKLAGAGNVIVITGSAPIGLAEMVYECGGCAVVEKHADGSFPDAILSALRSVKHS